MVPQGLFLFCALNIGLGEPRAALIPVTVTVANAAGWFFMR